MINQALHLQPVALDIQQHRELKVAWPLSNFAPLARLNSIFLATVEFTDACRARRRSGTRGKDDKGQEQYAPIVVLGLKVGQNLFLDGGRWRARYMPAMLNTYPFCTALLEEGRFAVCADMSYSGFASGEGQPLFNTDGQPSPLLAEAQRLLQILENEAERTRAQCARLAELGLLRDMQIDATLPDGRKHRVDGFLTVDAEAAGKLGDAVVGEMHRSGLLALIHAHWVSLGNTRHLLERYVEAEGKAEGAADDKVAGAVAAAAG